MDDGQDPWQGLASPADVRASSAPTTSSAADPWANVASPALPQSGPTKDNSQNDNHGTQQGLSMPQMFQDKPGTYYGSILPFSQNEKTGETSLALPEFLRSAGRGAVGLMQRAGGQYPVNTDTSQGGPEAPLNSDELGSLTTLSPFSAVKAGPNVVGQSIDAAGNTIKSVVNSGATSAAKDAAANTTIGRGIMARNGDELEEAAQAIKNNSSAKYKDYRDSGVVLTPEAGTQIVNNIEKSLGRISPRRQGDTLSVLSDLKDKAADGNLGLDDLDDFRQDFRDVYNDHTDFTGRTKSDGYKASQAIDALDSSVDSIAPEHLASGDVSAIDALKSGRVHWAQYRKFDAIANVMKQADGDPNKLKAGLTRFLNKGKNTNGWSDDEIAGLQTAARNSTGEKLLKTVGKFGIDLGSSLSPGNTALPALTGFTGLGTGPVHGVPMVAAGTLARQGQKYLARGKAEQLLSTIEQNARNADFLGQAAGGRIKPKSYTGKVVKKPVSYPALAAMRQRP